MCIYIWKKKGFLVVTPQHPSLIASCYRLCCFIPAEESSYIHWVYITVFRAYLGAYLRTHLNSFWQFSLPFLMFLNNQRCRLHYIATVRLMKHAFLLSFSYFKFYVIEFSLFKKGSLAIDAQWSSMATFSQHVLHIVLVMLSVATESIWPSWKKERKENSNLNDMMVHLSLVVLINGKSYSTPLMLSFWISVTSFTTMLIKQQDEKNDATQFSSNLMK